MEPCRRGLGWRVWSVRQVKQLTRGGGFHFCGRVRQSGPGIRGRKGYGRPFFEVLAGDIVPKKKPAPDIYLLTLERLQVSPEKALIVEDSRNGLLAAVAAGGTLCGHFEQLHLGRRYERGALGGL